MDTREMARQRDGRMVGGTDRCPNGANERYSDNQAGCREKCRISNIHVWTTNPSTLIMLSNFLLLCPITLNISDGTSKIILYEILLLIIIYSLPVTRFNLLSIDENQFLRLSLSF